MARVVPFPKAPACSWLVQNIPVLDDTMVGPVTSGDRLTGNGAWNPPRFGRQSLLVMRLPTGVQGPMPASGPFPPPASHTPATHFGHGSVKLPVTNTRDDRLMLTTASPVDGVTVPLGSVRIAFSTQVVRTPPAKGFGIGSGGPKKQLASGAQEPASPPHWVSIVQAIAGVAMQCIPGPAPSVQLSRPDPAFA